MNSHTVAPSPSSPSASYSSSSSCSHPPFSDIRDWTQHPVWAKQVFSPEPLSSLNEDIHLHICTHIHTHLHLYPYLYLIYIYVIYICISSISASSLYLYLSIWKLWCTETPAASFRGFRLFTILSFLLSTWQMASSDPWEVRTIILAGYGQRNVNRYDINHFYKKVWSQSLILSALSNTGCDKQYRGEVQVENKLSFCHSGDLGALLADPVHVSWK